MISLTAEQRGDIPKMGDATIPFVEKVLDYAQSNPEFTPAYMNVGDLKIDFEAVKDLNTIYRPLLQLQDSLNDSIMLSGSEAYIVALSYYNSVKMGAKMNIPGAKAIYDDLKKRFAKSPRKKTNEV